MKEIKNVKSVPSYEVNTLGLEVGPIHKSLLGYFNEMHEARAKGDTQVVENLELIVPNLLVEFEDTECRNTPNPGWLAGKMRGGWHYAQGDIRNALKNELVGYHFANEETISSNEEKNARNRRKSVSASNIADELRRLGRAKEGLQWAQLSVNLWSSNSINYLILGITAYYADLKDQANEIFSNLQNVADFEDEQDVLSKCMQFERELSVMADLPAVKSLMEKMGGE